MKAYIQGLAIGFIVAAAAVGFAGPASAEPPSGSYTGTIIDGGGIKQEGATAPATMTPCGPDCVTLQLGGPPSNLQLQGNAYTGTVNGCTYSLQQETLLLARTCPDQPLILIGFTKNP